MQVHVRHSPSFAVARALLAPGEQLSVEAGGMIAHSAGMTLTSDNGGGIMRGLKRTLAGGSFYVSKFTAPAQGGWVDVAGVLPGDICILPIAPDRPFFISKGSWMANSSGATVDMQWGGMANMFGGEGGFGLRASGQGEAILSIYGAADYLDLQPGEQIVVDTGHVVAYDLGIQFSLRRATQGMFQSMKSGEGFVFDFTGPGRLLLQTRNPDAFASWAGSVRPGNNPREGLGGMGGGLFR
jgi:uncharacterized protein (TIGR00266 family)